MIYENVEDYVHNLTKKKEKGRKNRQLQNFQNFMEYFRRYDCM